VFESPYLRKLVELTLPHKRLTFDSIDMKKPKKVFLDSMFHTIWVHVWDPYIQFSLCSSLVSLMVVF